MYNCVISTRGENIPNLILYVKELLTNLIHTDLHIIVENIPPPKPPHIFHLSAIIPCFLFLFQPIHYACDIYIAPGCIMLGFGNFRKNCLLFSSSLASIKNKYKKCKSVANLSSKQYLQPIKHGKKQNRCIIYQIYISFGTSVGRI